MGGILKRSGGGTAMTWRFVVLPLTIQYLGEGW